MAEGGDLPSLKDGSDADFEFTCTPCGEDSIREEAVKYCPECQEYLCTSCTRHHGRQKITRAHKLLDKDDAKKDSLFAKTKCRHHPDRDIEMYCGTHDMVYCTMCIATEHRSCDGVNKIEDEVKSCFDQSEIHRILEENKDAHERITAVRIKQQKNISSLKEERNAIQEKLGEVESGLIGHIRKLKRETCESLNKCYAEMQEKLNSEISLSTNIVQEFEKTSEKLHTIADMDAKQQFIMNKLMKKNVSDANKLHANSESKGMMSVYFTENTDFIICMMSETSLGNVRADNENKKRSKTLQYKMKSKKELNVRVASDKLTPSISDICQLPDGSVMLTDHKNKSVKRLDIYYNMRDHCDVDDQPAGICCINKNEVAVKLNYNQIQFISVGTTLSKTRCIDITSGGDQYGLIFCAGQLWASKTNGVDIYNTTGNAIKSIEKDQKGNDIFKSISVQQMTVCGDTVIVTDSSDGAVCLNIDGTLKKQLRDSRLKTTRGVCASDDGTVFLCGYNSHNIMMFSNDGKCLGELVAKDAGLKEPISLCYDDKKHSIIVTCNKSDSIYVINLVE